MKKLKVLNLGRNSINDEGLQALVVEMMMMNHCTLERLHLSSNSIGSDGLQALTAGQCYLLSSMPKVAL